ncbi:TetR/AcrR family transcriptional regulator [Spirosoma koreense]
MEKGKRNRAATTERIINALEELLTERGLDGVGINVIAERAGVSKVLIYRYFGGIEGLLEYYVGMGRLIPHYSNSWLEQIRPTQPTDLANIWSGQALQLFRQFRSSRAAREILKATVKEQDSLAESISRVQDTELTNLVEQLAFIKKADYQATSAVILGALSYLTIQAQLDRPVIGIDLRSEEGWQRIEEAVKMIYKALNRMAIESPTTKVATKSASVAVEMW